jgi:hypothetical protein
MRSFSGSWDPWDDLPAIFSNYPWEDNLKLSMYFTYTSAQNYVRTLTQGVSLSDTRKLVTDYKKVLLQTVNVNTTLSRFETFFRQCLMNATSSMGIFRIPAFYRKAADQTVISDLIKNNRSVNRRCEEIALVNDAVKRSQGFFRKLTDSLTGTDITTYPVLFVRSVSETQGISDIICQCGEYIRGLYDIAEGLSELNRQGEFYRNETETVRAEGSVFRGLFIFIRILTTSLVHDFVLRRFLIAREELALKSCITREIILDSKIN